MKYPLLVVIHETLVSAEESIKLHADPNYYGSYHSLIHLSGFITYLTPPDCKAYAAANSIYINSDDQQEHINNSVNDFAYHIALETPYYGIQNQNLNYHTGFTKEQYKSLAWLIKATGVAKERIVTHDSISLQESLVEPKCFNSFYLSLELEKTLNEKSIDFGILDYNYNNVNI